MRLNSIYYVLGKTMQICGKYSCLFVKAEALSSVLNVIDPPLLLKTGFRSSLKEFGSKIYCYNIIYPFRGKGRTALCLCVALSSNI